MFGKRNVDAWQGQQVGRRQPTGGRRGGLCVGALGGSGRRGQREGSPNGQGKQGGAAGTPEEVYRSPAMEQIFGILPDLSSLRAPTEKRTAGEEGTAWN